MSLTIVLWVLAVAILAVLALTVYRTNSMAVEAGRLVPKVGQIQRVRGGSIHYVDLGPKDAQPLVLIHGLSGQLQHFTYAVASLLKDEYRVIAVDRPGCGYSERDDDALAVLPEQGRMIGEALDALGLEKPVLVGHSLGGAVALAIALDRPQQTGALALICPLTQHQGEAPDVFKGLQVKSPLMRRLIGHTIAVPMAAATAHKVLPMVFHPEPAPDDFLIRAGGALGLRPKGFITAAGDMMMQQTSMPAQVARYPDELRVSGGILFGAADVILSPAAHGQTMLVHGLTCETLEGRGHMIPITAPEECAEFIRRMAAKAS